VTFLCPENTFKGKATHPRAKAAIREQIHRGDEKFIASVEQKKGTVTSFFQPVGITLHELLDLRLGEGKTVERNAETTKHFLKGAVSDQFIDLNWGLFGRWPKHIAVPTREIGINVSENVRSAGKGFLTIGRTEH
jgi:hypothetical protein